MINKVSKETKNKILNKSAKRLPDNPSAVGMKPEDIKRAFYAPITDAGSGVLEEIDRIAEEMNRELERISENSKENCTKDELDAAVAGVMKENYYTKSEVNKLLENVEVDMGDYYTKEQTDQVIDDSVGEIRAERGNPFGLATLDGNGRLSPGQVPALPNHYTKSELDEMLGEKADSNSVYEKKETYSREETFSKGEVKALIPPVESLVKVKIYKNIEVMPVSWEDTDNTDFPAKVDIPLDGITEKDVADVCFGISDATGGQFAPVTSTYDGGVTVYRRAVPTEAVVIPTVLCYLHEVPIPLAIEVGNVINAYFFNPEAKNAEAMYAWLCGLPYDGSNICTLVRAEGVDMVYATKLSNNYLLSVDNGHEKIVVYAYAKDSVNGLSKGWQNLDENNEVLITDLGDGYEVTYVFNYGEWNARILGKRG